MRILLLSPNPLVRELGAPKVLIELAEAIRELGAAVDLLGSEAVGYPPGAKLRRDRATMRRIRDFVRSASHEYDVIEVDHEWLPFPRSDFSPGCLIVARSVLLVFHLAELHIPLPTTLKGLLTFRMRYRWQRRERIRAAWRTVQAADCVNVSCEHDVALLRRWGVPDQKIFKQPFGLSEDRRAALAAAAAVPAKRDCIAFIGTLDHRKGGHDLPAIMRAVLAARPDVRFKLIGTGGPNTPAGALLRAFDASLLARMTVVQRFNADELPSLLTDCVAGVFPSYYEGFGFGILEMLAAGLPVVAYRAPGPPEMLPDELLAEPRDVLDVGRRLVELVDRADDSSVGSAWAMERARDFIWDRIATRTIDRYATGLSALRR